MVHAVGWQRLEGALALVAAVALVWHLDGGLPWWSLPLIFFAPDLSFFSYLLGPKVGAFGYNLVHLYGAGLVLLGLGLLASMPVVATLGALWIGHVGFDRLSGYGLKSPEGFNVTHMGPIGKHRAG